MDIDDAISIGHGDGRRAVAAARRGNAAAAAADAAIARVHRHAVPAGGVRRDFAVSGRDGA